MKKTYLIPSTDVALVETQLMIAGSNNYGQPEQGQDLSQAEETNATSGNLSRRRSVWGEEDDLLEENY